MMHPRRGDSRETSVATPLAETVDPFRSGGKALGRFAVDTAGPVLLILEESGRSALHRRLDKLARGRALEADRLAELYFAASKRARLDERRLAGTTARRRPLAPVAASPRRSAAARGGALERAPCVTTGRRGGSLGAGLEGGPASPVPRFRPRPRSHASAALMQTGYAWGSLVEVRRRRARKQPVDDRPLSRGHLQLTEVLPREEPKLLRFAARPKRSERFDVYGVDDGCHA
jgi:hypothetical protein